MSAIGPGGSTRSADFTVVGGNGLAQSSNGQILNGNNQASTGNNQASTGNNQAILDDAVPTSSARVQQIAIKERVAQAPQLDDLFIFTSLKCNKTCHHCYVSSSPTNTTLDDLQAQDLQPLWAELEQVGARNIYFSGGEPFLIPEILELISQAARHAPVTIYTNASEPLQKKLDKLKAINQEHIQKHGKSILLRVSFDHYDPAIHNIYYGRGKDAYARSLEVTREAARSGLDVAITTQQDIHNNAPDSFVERSFRKVFDAEQIALNDVKVLPDIPTGQHAGMSTAMLESPITETEFAMLGSPAKNLMCHTGRTVIKLDGRLQYFPCTLIIPDTPETKENLSKYSMGSSLAESLEAKQPLDHPACRAYCVHGKQSCAN